MVSERDGLYASPNVDHKELDSRSKTASDSPDHGDHTVLIVHSEPSRIPIISSHRLPETVGLMSPLPDVGGWSHVSLRPDEIVLSDKKLQKMLRSSQNSLERVGGFLGSAKSASEHSHGQTMHKGRTVTSVTVGKGAFVSTADASKGLGRLIFTRMHLKYANGLSSTQYLRSRCGLIQPEQLRGASIAAQHGIDINTGMCLFSRAVISKDVQQSSGGESQLPVPLIPEKAPITMYEAEIITRLSTTIADTVGLIRHAAVHTDVPIRVNIDIPEFQYYWTAIELLSQGKISTGYVQEWMAAIDERKRQLFAVMKHSIAASLKRRGLRGVDVILASGTESAANLFKQKVAISADIITGVTVEDFLVALQRDGDDAWQWKEFLNHLKEDLRPTNFQDLCKLMYVFKAVKPAFARCDMTKGTPCTPGLIIQLDDINEYKIFEKAKAFTAQYNSRLPIIGLNPMENVFLSGPSRSSFYLEDPGHLFFSNAGDQIMDPVDVIGVTYDAQHADLLRSICRSEGLPVGSFNVEACRAL